MIDQHKSKTPFKFRTGERRQVPIKGSAARKSIKKQGKFLVKHEGKEKASKSLKKALRSVFADPKKSKHQQRLDTFNQINARSGSSINRHNAKVMGFGRGK